MKESGLRDILRSLFGRTAMVVATVAIVGSGSIKAHAETQLMPDGNYFDPEYYAQTNPDVVASFGTDPNSLYYHSLTHLLVYRLISMLHIMHSHILMLLLFSVQIPVLFTVITYPSEKLKDVSLMLLRHSHPGSPTGRFLTSREWLNW